MSGASLRVAPWSVQQRWTLVAAIIGSGMAFIDASVVNVALSALQRSFQTDAAGIQWVVNAYALVLAAFILVGGVLGDRFGRRRVFGTGVLVFALGSLLCGLSPGVGWLIGARLLQGLGGALLIPGSLALIDSVFPDGQRGRAVGVWSAATSSLTVFGPTLGGLFVDAGSWRLVFLVNLPLAALVFLCLRAVPESLDQGQIGRAPDLPGAVLVVLSLGSLTYGLISSGGHGLTLPSLLLVLGGLLGMGLFVAWEARATNPMLPLGLFRSAAFSGSNALTFLLYGALGVALVYLPLDLIGVQGYSAAAAGAAFLPFSLLLAGLSGFFGGLVDRIGPRLLLTVGPLLTGVGFVLLGSMGVDGSFWLRVFPAMALVGLGMAVTVAPLTSTVLGAVPASYAGTASGVNNAVARAAGLLALAGFTLLMLASFHSALSFHLDQTALLPAAKTQMLSQSAMLAQVPIPKGLLPELATAGRQAIRLAFADSFRWLCLGSGLLAALAGVVAALSLRAPTGRPPGG